MAVVDQPTQCRECPWRDMDDPAFTPEILAAAQAGVQFICHTRMGGCPGPRLSTPQEHK